jgi:hypothetical protein
MSKKTKEEIEWEIFMKEVRAENMKWLLQPYDRVADAERIIKEIAKR